MTREFIGPWGVGGNCDFVQLNWHASRCLLSMYWLEPETYVILIQKKVSHLPGSVCECRCMILHKVFQISDERVLSLPYTHWKALKEFPVRFREHCGSGGKNNLCKSIHIKAVKCQLLGKTQPWRSQIFMDACPGSAKEWPLPQAGLCREGIKRSFYSMINSFLREKTHSYICMSIGDVTNL